MTFENIKKRIADNLGVLASDDSTIVSGIFTETSIGNKVNDIYLEVLFPYLSDKFPQEFEQTTYPVSTYTATGTVSASSTSTTLIATTSIFANSMEGFQVYNATDDEYVKIVTYSSATQVTVDTTIGDTWDGDTIYVLGNEFTLGGGATDAKELSSIGIKYNSSDSYFTQCTRANKRTVMYESDRYSTASPIFYETTVDVGGVPTSAIGIIPYPTHYDGKLQLLYTERPSSLSSSSDEPRLRNAGISDVIINGVTAWGFRRLDKFNEAERYEERDPRTGMILPKGTLALVRNLKLKTRSGPHKIKLGDYYNALYSRNI
jgi:hypothetical protein